MGRHAADDGDRVHPLVAAALEARQPPQPGGGPAVPRHGDPVVVASSGSGSPSGSGTTSDGEGGLGWPGPPGDGEGLGWPADTDGEVRATRTVSSTRLGTWLRWARSPRRSPKARQDPSAA